MSRGFKNAREVDRVQTCANCRSLRHLRFEHRAPRLDGRTGLHFCRLQFRETGHFEEQPWDFTCADFEFRGRAELVSVPSPAAFGSA